MDWETARGIAYYSHYGRRNPFGEMLIEHVARVAAVVPPSACATAWLHAVLEHSDTRSPELRDHGLTGLEEETLQLLTRAAGESFELHVLRIVHASGAAGDLARTVKLAAVDDHLAQASQDPVLRDEPPYAWARRHLASACHTG
ncbi:MAG: hypothetical protein QOF26_1648 [Baekduia sp.]|nr:hypothetical protein [Baekduia sp.]